MRKQEQTFSLYILFFLFLHFLLFADQKPDLQLVESIPVETKLGLDETSRTQEIWLDLIESATASIDMEFFYISHKEGEGLDPILNALKVAVNQGIRVRIITDARMAETYPQILEDLNQFKNITVRRISFFNDRRGVMHAKYFIVDKRQVFIGSQNMDWRALQHIHELGIRVRNSRLASLFSHLFELDWSLAGNETSKLEEVKNTRIPSDLRITSDNPLKLENIYQQPILLYPTFSPKDAIPSPLEWDERAIIRLINQARQRIEVQLLSYKPVRDATYYAELETALRAAAARGVKVRMIVSNWNTRQPGIRYLKSLHTIPNFEVGISTIPQWSGGFIPYARVEHCKYLIVDDAFVWIGTSNWSRNYFHNSRNVGLVIQNPSINETVRDIFNKSWDSSYCSPLDLCKEYTPPEISGSGD